MFWDSSAVVPILLPEPTSGDMSTMVRADHEPAIWWACSVECRSAIHRRNRESPLPGAVVAQALFRLEAFADDADTIPPAEEVRRRAGRLLAVHPLRAADALQLAAALLWCENEPTGERFVCLDERLRGAARTEGFTVLPA